MPRASKPRNTNSQPVSPSAFGQVMSYLATAGYSHEGIIGVIGSAHGGRDRYEIAQLLMDAL